MEECGWQLCSSRGRYAKIPFTKEVSNCFIMEWNLKNTMFIIVLVFLKYKGAYDCLFNQIRLTMEGNGIRTNGGWDFSC